MKQTKPYIFRGDFDGIENNLQNVGLAGLKKAEGLAANPRLSQLFARLIAKDINTLEELKPLRNGNIPDIIRGAVELCGMFNYKTNQITQFLQQRN